MLDVMREKATKSRGLHGRLMTKNEVALEGAKVDDVVASDSGVAMLAKLTRAQTAVAKQLDELREDLAANEVVASRARRNAITVASAVMSGGPDEVADEADEADEAEDAAVEIPRRKRVRAQSTRSPKKAKVSLPECNEILTSGKNKGKPCGSTG